jgi:hypothetical protein
MQKILASLRATSEASSFANVTSISRDMKLIVYKW